MTVDNLSMDKVKLFAEQVDLKLWSKVLITSIYMKIMTSFNSFAL